MRGFHDHHSRRPAPRSGRGGSTIGTTSTICPSQSWQGGRSPYGAPGAGSYPSDASSPRQSRHHRCSGGVPVKRSPQLGQDQGSPIAFMFWSPSSPHRPEIGSPRSIQRPQHDDADGHPLTESAAPAFAAPDSSRPGRSAAPPHACQSLRPRAQRRRVPAGMVAGKGLPACSSELIISPLPSPGVSPADLQVQAGLSCQSKLEPNGRFTQGPRSRGWANRSAKRVAPPHRSRLCRYRTEHLPPMSCLTSSVPP